MPYYDKRTGMWIGEFRAKGHPRGTQSFKLKRDAKSWEAKQKSGAKKTLEQASKGMDFLTFAAKYLDFAKAKYTGKTYHEKKLLISMFAQFLQENLPVAQISPEHVNDFLLAQVSLRSANCANRDRKNLLAMWNWGQKILDIRSNPVAKMERFAHTRREQYVPPEQDILQLLGVANRKERLFLNCYLHTAARRSEIFRLKWTEDINFERQEIRLGTRKTKDGGMEYSWMPMTEELSQELMWHYKQTPPELRSGHLFTVEIGRYSGLPFTYRHKFLKGLCKRASTKDHVIRPFGFHALRRYAASILADKFKVSSKTIQRILRHKNLSTTEVYIKRLNQDLRATIELLGSEQSGNQSGKNGADGAKNGDSEQ